jgi:hypothetical protein
MWLVAGGISFYGARFARKDGGAFRSFTIAGALAVATTSLVFGALVVVPAMAAVNTMGQMLTTSRQNRTFVVLMNVLAVVAPTGLALAGAHPARTGPTSAAAFVLAALMGVGILLLAARFTASYRDELAAVHTKTALHTWQLRRLVPERASVTPPSP